MKERDTSADDADRKRGGNETKTRLTTRNDTRRTGVLATPYIDEVGRVTELWLLNQVLKLTSDRFVCDLMNGHSVGRLN